MEEVGWPEPAAVDALMLSTQSWAASSFHSRVFSTVISSRQRSLILRVRPTRLPIRHGLVRSTLPVPQEMQDRAAPSPSAEPHARVVTRGTLLQENGGLPFA